MRPRLGVIAGAGQLPITIAESGRRSGREIFVAAIEGSATPGAFDAVPHIWLPLGAVGRLFAYLRDNGVEEVVLAGAVRRPALTEIKPDFEGALLLAKFASKVAGDDSVLSLVVREIERRGFRVVGAHEVLQEVVTPAGVCGGRLPDDLATRDIARALEVALALGSVDVGQAVVVQQGLVLGVEAIEGTDALLQRCAELRRDGPGGVLVKIAKPAQERRADLPTIGAQTVENAARAGLRGIALEAGGSMILDRAATVDLADRLDLFVTGITVARG